VFHSKWESTVIRDKYLRFLNGLFGAEEDLARFCEDSEVSYVVCQIDFALDGSSLTERYQAGLTDLPTSACAFLMHFYPERLRRFTVVYQNSFYRVLQQHDEGARPMLEHRLPFEAVWDAEDPPLDSRNLSEGVARRALAGRGERIGLTAAARDRLRTSDLREARRILDHLLAVSPDAEEGLLLRAQLNQTEENLDAALTDVRKGLETHPESSDLWFAKGQLLRAMGRHARAIRAYEATLDRNPDHLDAQSLLRAYEEGRSSERAGAPSR
jgi:tetratricopeptide (TPR) repeat protein